MGFKIEVERELFTTLVALVWFFALKKNISLVKSYLQYVQAYVSSILRYLRISFRSLDGCIGTKVLEKLVKILTYKFVTVDSHVLLQRCSISEDFCTRF